MRNLITWIVLAVVFGTLTVGTLLFILVLVVTFAEAMNR